MAENENLNPNNIDLSMQQQAAAAPAPQLTLNYSEPQQQAAPQPMQLQQQAQQAVVDTSLDETKLSPEERKMVDDFSKKIDITDSTMIMTYGGNAQQKVADFSDSALASVRTKDLGETGGMILDLVEQLKSFSALEQEKGFKLFRKPVDKLQQMKSRYDKVEVSVDKIAGELESHQVQLLKDISVMDKLYEVNLANFKELSLYIIAGRKALGEARNTNLRDLTAKAAQSGLPEDAQAANDYAQLCDRFEKKLHDLELTRMVAIQSGPQIRLIQNNDTIMSEKIQTTVMNTIPLWKSQMLIAMGLQHSQQALQAEQAVTDMTNALLKKNADMLKTGTIAVAKEAERGIVDIETLNYTNAQLISTLDEVLKIQNEGREKRRSAEVELVRMEGELKQKLLDIHQ